jgi:hypothetical protein
MRQARAHTWASDISPNFESLQDLSIRVNTEVDEEVIHHASLGVDGCLHFRLHGCKIIYLFLESSNPFHHVLSLVSPITDVLLQRSVPVEVPSRGGGFSSEARLRITMRGVVTTLMVTRVATSIPSVPLGLLRVSLWCSHGLMCCLRVSSPASVRCPVKLWRASPIRSNCSVSLSQEYSRRPGLGN